MRRHEEIMTTLQSLLPARMPKRRGAPLHRSIALLALMIWGTLWVSGCDVIGSPPPRMALHPPHSRWEQSAAAPDRLLLPTMGIFRRTGWRGDASWMQADYRSGDAVVQVTAIRRLDAAERSAAFQAWRADQEAQQRQVRDDPAMAPLFAWSMRADGRNPAACWVHGVYVVRATMVTPHDADTLRLFLAQWR